MILSLSSEALLNAAIALVVTVQAWIAFRIWRPKIVIYTSLTTRPKPGGYNEVDLDIGNLSPVGLWIESLEIVDIHPFTGKKGAPLVVRIEKVAPAFAPIHFPCTEHTYDACPDRAGPSKRVIAKVQIRVRYRAFDKLRESPWRPFFIDQDRKHANTVKPWDQVTDNNRKAVTDHAHKFEASARYE